MRLNYTLLRYKGVFDIKVDNPLPGVLPPMDKDKDGYSIDVLWHTLGAEYTYENWLIAAEYELRRNDYSYGQGLRSYGQMLNDVGAFPANPFHSPSYNKYVIAWYLSIQRQLTVNLSAFGSYGEATNGRNPGGLPADYYRETNLGFRYDITQNLLFKAQGTLMRGYRDVNNKFDGDAETDWGYALGRLTWHF
ncbi:MAG: hypothetical protein HQL32_09825 [Planctomycetes bacterium]|nr:hypothetical protein [Planctomycetota bacterium]